MVRRLPSILLQLSGNVFFSIRGLFFYSFLLSVCTKENCSSSPTSEEDDVTSIGVVSISCRILRRSFCVFLSSSLEKKSAAVFTGTAVCAIVKLSCNTSPHAFKSDGGLAFVWKKTRLICFLSRRCLVLLYHTNCVRSRGMLCELPKFLSNRLTFWVEQARKRGP